MPSNLKRYFCINKSPRSSYSTLTSSYDEISTEDTKILSKYDLLLKAVAEFLATMFYMFLSCMGCICFVPGYGLSHFERSFVAGLAVMVSMHCFGHISGAHVNPLTSICAFLLNDIPFVLLPLYITMQVAGSILGFGLFLGLTPIETSTTNSTNDSHAMYGQCLVSLPLNLQTSNFIGLEFAFAAILAFANCAVFEERKRMGGNGDFLPLKYGMLVAVLTAVSGSLWEASFNPIRSFGPAIWNNRWPHHWVYWVPTVMATVMVSLLYRMVY